MCELIIIITIISNGVCKEVFRALFTNKNTKMRRPLGAKKSVLCLPPSVCSIKIYSIGGKKRGVGAGFVHMLKIPQ